jgi:transcriptional regulator with XRE-family HTH domain
MDISELRKKYKLSQSQLGELTGIPFGRINGWEQQGSNPKGEDSEILKALFNKLSKFDQSILSNGKRLKSNDIEKIKTFLQEEDKIQQLNYTEYRRSLKNTDREEYIPIFNRADAKKGKMIESLIPLKETDKIGLIKRDLFKNAQFVIKSTGNSMLPTYPPDAWVGIRQIEPYLIIPGSTYVLDVGSDLIFKRIHYKNDDQYSGVLLCVSDNTMIEESGARKGLLKYPPYYIDMKKVLGVYKVTEMHKPNEIQVIQ